MEHPVRIEADALRAVAAAECRSALAGRLVQGLGALFALLALAIALAGLGASGQIVVQGFTRTAVSLLSLALYLLPLVGLVLGAHALGVEDGGTELDMVVNIGKVIGGDLTYVKADIAEVLAVTRQAGKKLKVIFENAYLEDAHKRALCELCAELAVDWVKTSTGFGPSGATLDDLRLMRAHTPPTVQVKASGGIRSLAQVREIQALGVSRIGTSSSRTRMSRASACASSTS